MTDYKFGSHNPRFSGTDAEWKQLKETIAWWNEDTSHYPYVVRGVLFNKSIHSLTVASLIPVKSQRKAG